MSDYTLTELCTRYDDLSREVRTNTKELQALDSKIDMEAANNLKAHQEAKDERYELRFKVIQMFKELFGDKDSGRRGLATSHRETDGKVDDIYSLLKQARIAYVVGAALIIAFIGAVWNGTITLEFLNH